MGRTLFWYIFKDLLKIFFMASGALAGIMSFGGLLRPLTQQGLDASQVSKMLGYFTPAMTAYSFPVAALFAATMVYGRLSADNELTACRAGGIGLGPFFGMAFPAVMFGLIVAIVSLLFLCFIVPIYTLKVEQVIYSNMAKLIANRIDRTHEIKFLDYNVFAQKAYLPEDRSGNKDRQRVVLEGVSIVTYERGKDVRFKVPREFLLASSATIEISEKPEQNEVEMLIGLEGGTKFPREYNGSTQAGIGTTQFGPLEIPSLIREDTKFMDVLRLKRLYNHPEESTRIKNVVADFIRHDQIDAYLKRVAEMLNYVDPEHPRPNQRIYTFEPADPHRGHMTLRITDKPRPDGSRVEAVREGPFYEELAVHGVDPATVTFERSGDPPTVQIAKELRLHVRPDTEHQLMHVTIELLERTPYPGAHAVSGNYSAVIAVPMTADISALAKRHLSAYTNRPAMQRNDLARESVVLSNAILSESNTRASFAVSCFILVLVGCALGMMFRSGNFLTAFAVSFVPALLCITLIVSGQQTCHAVPWKDPVGHNPLKIGLALIWSGNAMNFIIALFLLFKLQKQ